MFKKLLFAFCLLSLTPALKAQETSVKNIDFYGFVRNELFIDSYKGVDAAFDVFYLAPLYIGQDANGEDINQQPSSHMSALASRLGAKVSGPEIFGAQTNATIEFDFGGIVSSEPTLFRIRHAYASFNWESAKLIIGQTWHPFWGGGCFPTVASLNTGAPFQAFNRSPLIRYDQILGKLTVSGTMAYENQYASKSLGDSPFSTRTQAQRNGALPEMILSAEYNNSGFTLGAAASLKRIKPAMTTTGANGTYKSTEYLTSTAFTGYFKYSTEKFKLTAKAYYGENMTHLTLPGGYGVATHDETTGKETYTNYNNITSLLNIVYGTKWQVGIFLGYGENLGTDDPLYDNGVSAKTAGLLQGIMDMTRVAPSLSLNVSKFKIMAEYEMTSANYGTGGFNFNDGLYADKHNATNNRFILMTTYTF